MGVVLSDNVCFKGLIAEMAVDPAFKGVGKKEGLEIFRIEVSAPYYVACGLHHVIKS